MACSDIIVIRQSGNDPVTLVRFAHRLVKIAAVQGMTIQDILNDPAFRDLKIPKYKKRK